MLSATARKPLLDALEVRIRGVDDSATAVVGSGRAAEEALRELMVRYLPATGASSHDTRGAVCDLLLAMEPPARAARDLRFLDAYNVFFERVSAHPEWLQDVRWLSVQSVYRHLLSFYCDRLRNDEAIGDAVAPGSGEFAEETLVGTAEHGRVLVLADYIGSGLRTVAELASDRGIQPHLLVCNNRPRNRGVFLASQLAGLARAGVPTRTLASIGPARLHLRQQPIHDPAVSAWLRSRGFWLGVHDMGVIYRADTIVSFGAGILNAHIGLLPWYRGRSVMEWSVLAGSPTGVTVFFIDEGIDTGRRLVIRRPVPLSGFRTVADAKTHLFGTAAICYREAIAHLLRGGPMVDQNVSVGRRYYVMSGLLSGVVGRLLRERDVVPATPRVTDSSHFLSRPSRVAVGGPLARGQGSGRRARSG
jgi:folate-dependent phosphoribosylglycinamide formyltransferase PurN